jgi:hypothetical protein
MGPVLLCTPHSDVALSSGHSIRVTAFETCLCSSLALQGQNFEIGPIHSIYFIYRPTGLLLIDYRCDNRRSWLSAHNCQVPTPTSQNLEFEQQIRIFGAD